MYCPITRCRLKSQLNTARTQWNFRPALISAIDLSVGEVHDTTNTKCFVSYRLYICQIPALHWAVVHFHWCTHSLCSFFTMDLQSSIPSSTIFVELQTVHDTGYFYSLPSLEDDWAQVTFVLYVLL